MHRFYISPDAVNNERTRLMISGDDAHHMVNVLRLNTGEKISVSDQNSTVYSGIITEQNSGEVTVAIQAERQISRCPISFSVFQSMPKSTKMDDVVQAVTQLGAAKIIPFISERTIVRLDAAKEQKRLKRWRIIAKESSALAFRDEIPVIDEIKDLSVILREAEQADLSIVFWEEQAEPLDAVLSASLSPKTVGIIIGPEGGFSSKEVEAMTERGISSASMGRYIFRTEIAAAAGLAMLQYHYHSLFF